MVEVTLVIDGKSVKANEGETILNVARANDIFIPALCYMTRCSPTLACRLCMVESDGKQVYSCNTKIKEGMNIITVNENISKERYSIMQVYDINHPLQCGVCDKSGECELQNYSLYMQVNSQDYSIKDTYKPVQKWGVMNYDPALCIVCERCVTVCKDMIGSNALSTVKRGSDAIDKVFKEQMPKDSYAMWNKLNKSLISYDSSSCTDCGECISACPVGALFSKDFTYSSNAWELEKIPASNPYSADCSLMYYEVKQESIINHKNKKIYRVTNEPHYFSLNGAGRFAFNYSNEVQNKDKEAFFEAIKAFKKAQYIKFNSYITNEEAFILQKIADFTGAKLVNEEAKRYQEFLQNFSLTSGKNLYSSSLDEVLESDFVICLGAYLKSDLPNARYSFNNCITVNKGAGLYFHPLVDKVMEKTGKKGKNIEFIYHKPMIEEAILYFILQKFSKDLPKQIQDYINFLDDIKKQFEKDETFIEQVDSMLLKKENFSLIIGEDLIHHPKSQNLAKLCGLIDKYTDFKTLIIPPCTNSLGVSLICDLYEQKEGFTVGYNEKADFEISALGDGNLDMPSLNQQEGTFTSIDKKVVPTNVALPYRGYTLNDIANEILNLEVEHTIEYTKQLPPQSGYQNMYFDDLKNEFTNDQVDRRGYDLAIFETSINDEIKEYEEVQFSLSDDEIIIYKANPVNQFNEFSAISSIQKPKDGIFFSKELFEKLQLKEEVKVKVQTKDLSLSLDVHLDEQIDGNIAYVSTFMKNCASMQFFTNSRYNKAKITKV